MGTTSEQSARELMSQVQGVAPDVAEKLSTEYLFEAPEFSFEVKTTLKIPGAEKMNGLVVMKFPTAGDNLKISRIARALGANAMAEMHATLYVCITKAPASWYELAPDAKVPSLNLDRLPDDEALAALFLAFTEWQRSFR